MGWTLAAGAVVGAAAAPVVWVLARRLCRRSPQRVNRQVLGALVPICMAVGLVVVWGAPDLVTRLVLGIFAASVIAASVVDYAELRLPDVLTIPVVAAAVLVLPWLGDLQGWDHARPVWGVLIGGGWALLVAIVADQSLGDVKLAAGIGGVLAWHGWSTLALGVLAGQVLVAIVVGIRAVSRRRAGLAPTDTALGPALAAGAVAALLVCAA